MGEWINVFPSELEMGDVKGEEGALVFKYAEPWSYAWALGFSPEQVNAMRHPTFTVARVTLYCQWPERAPMRVYRPDQDEAVG